MQRPIFIALPLLSAACSASANTPLETQPFQEASPLWRNAPLSTPRSEQKPEDTMRALRESTPLAQELKQWRETVRGQGDTPLRAWTLARAGDSSLKLEVGQRAMPAFKLAGLKGDTPGIALALGGLAFGSTSPNAQLDARLQPYDAALGADASDANGPRATYLTASPLKSDSGALDLLLATGQSRADGDGQRARLSLAEARGEMGAGNWKLRGEWSGSREAESDAIAQAWSAGVEGDVPHPWGVARLEASLRDWEDGFASFNSADPESGRRVGRVSLKQNVALGFLSGSAKVTASGTDRTTDELLPDVARHSRALEGVVDGKLQVTSFLAVTAKHERRLALDQLAAPAPEAAEETWQLNRQGRAASEAGVEVRLPAAWVLSMGVGQEATNARTLLPDAAEVGTPERAARERLNVGLGRRFEGGQLGVQLSRERALSFDGSSTPRWDAMRVQGEGQVLPWLKLSGALKLHDEADVPDGITSPLDVPDERVAEAQLSLSVLGRLALRYADREQDADNRAKEYGVRYNLGKSSQGLGLSVEYARQPQATDSADSKWRLGLTYR